MSKVLGASVSTCFVSIFLMLSTFGKAASINDMTGKWYSETTEDKLFDGTIRKDLAVSRADGTKTITARYYAGNQCVAERIATFKWGVHNNVYWTECQTLRKYGAALACSPRLEYELISVTPNEFQYKSRKSGITYTNRRVSDDFDLPCDAVAAEANEAALHAVWSYVRAHPFYPAELTERSAEVRATVTLSIDGDGKLADAKVASGSRSTKTDQEILDWLKRLQPFPRVPANLTSPFKFSGEFVFVPPTVLSEVKIKWIIDANASANEAVLRDLIASHLRRQPPSYSNEMNSRHSTRRAIVTLLINQDGKLLNVEMTKGSGSSKVDQETQVWLTAAQPYPQVPMNLAAPLKLVAEIGFGPPSKGIWSDEKIKRSINNVCKGC
jgi:TonB family protein